MRTSALQLVTAAGRTCRGHHARTGQWQLQAACGAAMPQRWFSIGTTQTSPSKLSEVMCMDQLTNKSPEQISDIWLQFHSNPSLGRAGTVMSAEDWEVFQERARKSPMFVLPLAKPGGGYLTLLTQHQLPFTLVTSLEAYRLRGVDAPPCMTVMHYSELVSTAGLVLVRADVTDTTLVNTAEARTVLELVRALYTDDKDYKLVYDFNNQPSAFDFSQVLATLGLGSASAGAAAAASSKTTVPGG